MDNSARDIEIARRYRAGDTHEELAQRHQLTRIRIVQILKKAGITFAKDSPRAPRGDRYAYVGVNLTKALKAQLKERAARDKKSMSRFIEELIEARFKGGGTPELYRACKALVGALHPDAFPGEVSTADRFEMESNALNRIKLEVKKIDDRR